MTLADLQKKLYDTRYKRTIIAHLIEHLDENFQPRMDQQSKKVLLTDEKLKVPVDSFNEVANDLNNWMKGLLVEEQKLLSTPVTMAETLPQQAEAHS